MMCGFSGYKSRAKIIQILGIFITTVYTPLVNIQKAFNINPFLQFRAGNSQISVGLSSKQFLNYTKTNRHFYEMV